MMSEGLNPWELVKGASLIVQIVMGLLLIASVVSWSIMLRKRAELRRARIDADRFEEVFWSGGDLTAMFRAIDQGRRIHFPEGFEADPKALLHGGRGYLPRHGLFLEGRQLPLVQHAEIVEAQAGDLAAT